MARRSRMDREFLRPAAGCAPAQIYESEKRGLRRSLRSNEVCKRLACRGRHISPYDVDVQQDLFLLAIRSTGNTAVVDVSGKFAGQIEVVVDDVFEMDACGASVGEEGN